MPCASHERIAAHPGQVRARFNMANKIGGPIEQENVVAEIPWPRKTG